MREESEYRRTLVLGDVHGAYRALTQVLERAGFDRDRDRLIFLGDLVDGWPEPAECFDLLLSIPHLVALRGNHDEWLLEWISGRGPDPTWLRHGGAATLAAYRGRRENVPAQHRALLLQSRPWFQDDDRIYLHAGWSWYLFPHPMGDVGNTSWDREMWTTAVSHCEQDPPDRRGLTRFREVFIGHTPTTWHGWTVPTRRCEVWNMDQGAGWDGNLSIMDVDTKEFWQSDPIPLLYPEYKNDRVERRRTARLNKEDT